MKMLLIMIVLCIIIIANIFIEAQSIDFEILDSVLLQDILPPSSPLCRYDETTEENEKRSFASFEHKKSPSVWNAKYTELEPKLFLAEINHDDPDPSRIWKLRVGQGGNIYSFRGAFGEAIPPQNHLNGPFVDEVWQMVSVNQIQNRNPESPPYFVHQGGTYMNKNEFEIPFFSPNIAKHCEQKAGISQCSFGSWGQHAHIPTIYESSVLYFNRYQDCGNGVLEVTSVIQNIAKIPETLGYFNVPWGGVRTSNLQNLFLSKPDGEMYLHFPIQSFGAETIMPNLKDTGGYTSFVKDVKKSNYGFDPNQFYMPEVGNDGKVLPIHEVEKRRKQRRLKKIEMENANAKIAQQNKTNICEDEDMKGDNLSSAKINVISKEIDTSKSKLRLVIKNNNPCRESLNHSKHFKRRIFKLDIKPTVEIKSGEKVCSFIFENKRNGEKFAVQQILHWAWAGKEVYFSPMDDHVSPRYINERFLAGDRIKVTYTDLGTQGEDSLALTFVHGVDKDSRKNRIQLPSRLRFGITDLGRDYTVYTANIRTPINAGETYVNRQYIITDRLQNVKTQAAIWNRETYQNVIRSDEYKSRQIKLVSSQDRESFGAAVGDQSCERGDNVDICTGSSTPKPDLTAFFYIECGDLKYVGTNRYAFSLESEDERNNSRIIRSYSCVEGKEIRPTWKLLGYFKEGDCEDLNGLHFEPNLCVSPDVYAHNNLEQDTESMLGLSQSDEL